jgi:hypothetical protein
MISKLEIPTNEAELLQSPRRRIDHAQIALLNDDTQKGDQGQYSQNLRTRGEGHEAGAEQGHELAPFQVLPLRPRTDTLPRRRM